MKPRLLITRRVFDEVVAALAERFDIEPNPSDEEWSEDEMVRRIADKAALFVSASDQISARIIDAAPGLRIIATGSVGFNHIDLAACARRGIVVSNTPDVLNEATADMAWTLLMATARRVTEAERWLRDGQWDRWAWDQFLGADIHGATLGIIGMGRIGSAVARRARGFDMRVIYSNRSVAANEKELGATRVDRDTLLSVADHVVLVLPYSKETHHTIGAAELARMKPSAILVNIARGGIVDDEALAEALAAGRIAGAGLDVFEDEPRISPALLAQHRVVLTPHIGSATRSTRLAMAMLAARNLIALFEGTQLPSPVRLPG